ncbi:hypothetical protein HAX54_043031 [Datura stramonium]|uniref:Secreted protein n=1 Tax=Datura stramonium TaxID=4076 RepID=A0ABS8SMR3_DATST|nr:hypothetical protein [Datura stramonium]
MQSLDRTLFGFLNFIRFMGLLLLPPLLLKGTLSRRVSCAFAYSSGVSSNHSSETLVARRFQGSHGESKLCAYIPQTEAVILMFFKNYDESKFLGICSGERLVII